MRLAPASFSPLPLEILVVDLHTETRLIHIVGDESDRIDDEAVGGQFEKLFFPRLVPELVEKLVIVLLTQSCLDDRVQVLL